MVRNGVCQFVRPLWSPVRSTGSVPHVWQGALDAAC